jgi:cell fate regulator YaaT (PSP1 superfamily)
MGTFAEVGFKGRRREYFTASLLELRVGVHVIVEADRGEDLGELLALGAVAERKCSASGGCATPVPERKVVRVASEQDLEAIDTLRRDEKRVRSEARSRVAKLGLKMKITEAEWQFDRKKLTIFFTAERRVDFRALVRQLAGTFRTRIDLQQIGVRNESALLGGVGRCGRELCCSTWLPELKSVSLQIAKDQGLSLNPAHISGCCGRLMCCLLYEHRTYVQARRRFPREGKTFQTSRGAERVISVEIWGETISLRGEDGERRTVTLSELRREIESSGGSEHGKPRGVDVTAPSRS